MAHANKVIHSYNHDGALRRVDVFLRPDGTYGFEEYRREPEDARGWFPIGFFDRRSYNSPDAALAEAKTCVHWLAEVVDRS